MGLKYIFTDLIEKHEELKRRIHGFRVQIQNIFAFRAIQVLYFSLPIAGGICVMNWAERQSEINIGKHGEKLREKQQATID